MKIGQDLNSLVRELDRRRDNMKDLLADTRAMEAAPHMVEGDRMGYDGIALAINGSGVFPTNRIADGQLSSRLKIPKKYYDRMLDQCPDLLCTNINHWFNNEPEKRLVRTLDGNARAFLSEKYRPLDNYQLCEAVLPAILDSNANVVSCEVTDTKLYIKAVTHEVQADIKAGDTVSAGVVIQNSEVGHGSLSVMPYLLRLVCQNGMTAHSWGKRKYHTGNRQGHNITDLDHAYELYTDTTKEASDAAFWMQVRDLTKGVMSQATFEWIVNEMKQTVDNSIEGDPMDVVDKTQRKFKLNEEEKNGVMQHLLRGNDLSQWGLANAVTRTAEDIDSYDRATELEAVGWDVVELPRSQWKLLSA